MTETGRASDMTSDRVSDERLAEMVQSIEDDPEGVDAEEYRVLYSLRDARARLAAWEPVVREIVKETPKPDAECCALCRALIALPEEHRP